MRVKSFKLLESASCGLSVVWKSRVFTPLVTVMALQGDAGFMTHLPFSTKLSLEGLQAGNIVGQLPV